MPAHTCFHCSEICDCNEGYDDGCIGCQACSFLGYADSDEGWDESDSDFSELAYDTFCDPGDEDPADTDDEGSW